MHFEAQQLTAMSTPKRDKSRAGNADTPQVRVLSADGANGKLEVRLYTPAAAQAMDKGLIVFFPSGGFASVDLDDAEEFSQALSTATGCRVLASTYTVARIRPFPAAVEDAHAVLAWAARNRTKLGWDGRRLLTAGLEAGGNLAAVSAMMARDRGGPQLAGQLLIMPMLDPGLTSPSMRKLVDGAGAASAASECAAGYRAYLPNAVDRTHPYASPPRSSRMKGLPPALIVSADDDPLRDEAEQYAAKLIAAGIKTLVRRLPPIPLQQPGARCSCVRQDDTLQEIAVFIGGLDAPKEAPREAPKKEPKGA
jgi:acetyl esterase/lipase